MSVLSCTRQATEKIAFVNHTTTNLCVVRLRSRMLLAAVESRRSFAPVAAACCPPALVPQRNSSTSGERAWRSAPFWHGVLRKVRAKALIAAHACAHLHPWPADHLTFM